MSILLEALRKSEEQRQLGKTPSIHSPGIEPPNSRGGSQQWIPLTLMAVSAIAMAWIGWQQFRLPPGLQDGTALSQVRSDVRVADEAEAGQQAVADDPGQAAERPADTVVASRPDVSRRTPVESYRPQTQSPQEARPAPSVEAEGEALQEARASRSANDFETEAGAQSGAAAADVAPSVARDLPPAEAEAEPRQPRSESHVTEPISYWELPQGVRDSLPEMRITVLVYAERPQDRFLLLSGQRMVEKDQLEGGVVLEEIRRDGAVFQYRTYRFLLKG